MHDVVWPLNPFWANILDLWATTRRGKGNLWDWCHLDEVGEFLRVLTEKSSRVRSAVRADRGGVPLRVMTSLENIHHTMFLTLFSPSFSSLSSILLPHQPTRRLLF